MTDEARQIWEAKIANYHASGLTAKDWCAANGERLTRLKYWIREINKARKANSSVPTRWLPVEMSAPAPSFHNEALLVRVKEACIEVRSGFDPALLKGVVEALSSC